MHYMFIDYNEITLDYFGVVIENLGNTVRFNSGDPICDYQDAIVWMIERSVNKFRFSSSIDHFVFDNIGYRYILCPETGIDLLIRDQKCSW